MDTNTIKTLGGLKNAGYISKSIKEELRDNLIKNLESGKNTFNGILGYENTVIPNMERAILSRHNINFLGLRGQGKTKMARMMVNLLDEYIPIIDGSEINDDPLQPVSNYGKEMIAKHGDETPIEWLHRNDRYVEKLATPDVSISDLIGDIDPIKAARLKLDYADENVMHFGLVPRSNRSIFVINELPDLQPRIQVALFNILQEGDIQIRGFKVRLPIDIAFIFTANPEDYTNRGTIITPLKDRVQSQIITHYPKTLEIAKAITKQEANLTKEQRARITVPHFIEELIEEISFVARASEFVDQKSGVSARLSISAYENIVSTAERRAILNKEKKVQVRVGDLIGILPAITGKIELVYEGEQEGEQSVAFSLIGKAIRKHFTKYFPNPEQLKKEKKESPYLPIIKWFETNELNLNTNISIENFEKKLLDVTGLKKLVKTYFPQTPERETILLMEFLIHGLAEFSLIGKKIDDNSTAFHDLLGSVFSFDDFSSN